MQRYPMTVGGAEALRIELDRLKNVDRPRITAAIAEARAHGDLKENAEYHAAREQQSFAEGRIKDIEAKLSNVQIIDISKMTNNGKVIFGTTVDIETANPGELKTYQIVGEDEANIKLGKISSGSPIARGLIGKEEGDSVVITTPSGQLEYEISEVRYV